MSDGRAEFAALYARHGPEVFRFAMYLCGDGADAEDIAAETFARAWTSPTPIQNETVRGYLFTIARNVYLQRAKRSSRHVPLETDVPDRATTDSRVEARDELRSVNARLRSMPAIDRAALMLKADGHSYEEIGAALGVSPAAARVRVHRVRALLARGSTP